MVLVDTMSTHGQEKEVSVSNSRSSRHSELDQTTAVRCPLRFSLDHAKLKLLETLGGRRDQIVTTSSPFLSSPVLSSRISARPVRVTC